MVSFSPPRDVSLYQRISRLTSNSIKYGSARQSVKVFVLRGFLETHTLVLRSRQRRDLHQNGQNSGFAAEMTLGGTYGGILVEDLLPVPPSLETRTKRGFPHFHSDDGGGLQTATRPNPTKIGGFYRFLH